MAACWFRAVLLAVVLSGLLWPPSGAVAGSRPGAPEPQPTALQPSAGAQRLLAANGFAVDPADDPQLYSIYQANERWDMPSFVSSDLVLHVHHVLYDITLRTAERQQLAPLLQDLTLALLTTSQARLASAPPELREDAARAAGYFAVAARLLDPQAGIPDEVRELVSRELALIDGHAGPARSPLFDLDEDYSQYVPRGHYTREPALGRYFRAMMWYGRMTFRLDNAAATRRALLVVAALNDTRVTRGNTNTAMPAMDAWAQLYDVTALFAGRSDDLTVSDYNQLAQQLWGGLPLATLADSAELARFAAAATKLPPPRILGTMLNEGQPISRTAGLRFMGQRFTVDGWAMQNLLHDRVANRYLGRALDVMAALGSDRARAILIDRYGEDHYAGYTDALTRLQQQIRDLPADTWTENLYAGWLYALTALIEPRGAPYPAFMRGAAWTDRQLHAALGSWTELKHDSILYAKQPYSGVGAAAPRPVPPVTGYVEPQSLLYRRLAALNRHAVDELNARGLLAPDLATRLQRFAQLAERLADIGDAELAGRQLSADDADLIKHIGDTADSLTTFTPATGALTALETDDKLALVADVATDPNSQRALTVGLGAAFVIWALVPIGNDTVLTRGAVYSFYEFPWPIADRLTDEAWQQLSPRPALPAWTASFTANGPFEPAG